MFPCLYNSVVNFKCCLNNLIVTVDGDVLIVNSVRESMSYIWNFKIYKMGLSKGSKWEEVVTLANEAILLELGITVLANDMEGIKRNSIYFNCSDLINPYDENEIFIFNLDTKKVKQLNQFVCLSVQCSNARWFLPSFKREWLITVNMFTTFLLYFIWAVWK